MVRPRLNPLTALLVTSGVITGALCWGGWRLVMQQRAIDETRAVQQIEAAVDALAADIRRHVAETGERLAAALGASDAEVLPVEAAVVVVVRPDRVLVHPPRLPFLPLVPAPPAPGGLFADAEAAEFVTGDLRSAAARYRDLSHHRDPAVQVEALMRLGRVLRQSRDATAAAAAYERLSKLPDVRAAGVPADLLGLYGQYTVLQTAGPGAHDGQARVRAELVQGLQAGRWALARGTAEHYRDLLGIVERPEAWALAEALDRLWSEHGGRLPPRGRRTFTRDDRTVVTLWRSAGGQSAVAVAFGDEFFAARREQTYAWRLLDADGHQMAGTQMLPSLAVARNVGDGDEAWTLQVAAAVPAADARRRPRPGPGTVLQRLLSGQGRPGHAARRRSGCPGHGPERHHALTRRAVPVRHRRRTPDPALRHPAGRHGGEWPAVRGARRRRHARRRARQPVHHEWRPPGHCPDHGPRRSGAGRQNLSREVRQRMVLPQSRS
jgi:hypothetical protein